jgi:hypothetical protein
MSPAFEQGRLTGQKTITRLKAYFFPPGPLLWRQPFFALAENANLLLLHPFKCLLVTSPLSPGRHYLSAPILSGEEYYLFRFINSESIVSVVVMIFEFAWKFLCVVIILTNSLAISTFDCSREFGAMLPSRLFPGRPLLLQGRFPLSPCTGCPPIFVEPGTRWNFAWAIL